MSDPTTDKPGTSLRRILPRVVISLVIAGAFAWALERGGLPLVPTRAAVATLRWWGVPSFIVLMLASIYFRTSRWAYSLRPLSPDISAWRSFAVCLLGYGTVFFAPLRLGEIVRPYLIATKDSKLTFAQGLGTVAAERAIDGLITVMMTAVALGLSTPISPLPDHVGKLPVPASLVPRVLVSAALLFGVAFAGMFCLFLMRERANLLIRATVGRVSVALGERVAQLVERLGQGLTFLRTREALPFFRDTLLYWALSIAANWALLRGVGLDASFSQGAVCLGLICLGSLLPAGPGFFGAYQVAAYTALAMYHGMNDVTTGGAMFVLASYITHIGLNVVSCAVGFLMLGQRPEAPIGSSSSYQ